MLHEIREFFQSKGLSRLIPTCWVLPTVSVDNNDVTVTFCTHVQGTALIFCLCNRCYLQNLKTFSLLLKSRFLPTCWALLLLLFVIVTICTLMMGLPFFGSCQLSSRVMFLTYMLGVAFGYYVWFYQPKCHVCPRARCCDQLNVW